MTDVEREDVQRHVDEVRDRLGLPNHGVGIRCRVHFDRNGHDALWIRVHDWVDPKLFHERLAQALAERYDARINGSQRYCRITRR